AIAQSIQLALTAPRGPVHVEVAAPYALVSAESTAAVVRPVGRARSERAPAHDELAAAATLITSASRPVVAAGAGCRSDDVAAWLRPFAESLPAPVVVTARAKGVVPDPHPMCLGLVTGATARTVLGRADLVIALGVESDELTDWEAGAPVLNVGTV